MGNIGIARNVLIQIDTATGLPTGKLNVDGKVYTISLTGLDTLAPQYNTATARSNDKIWVVVNAINQVALTAVLNSGVVYTGDLPGGSAQFVFQSASNTISQGSVPTSSVGAVL
jgi:hypothetical protein